MRELQPSAIGAWGADTTPAAWNMCGTIPGSPHPDCIIGSDKNYRAPLRDDCHNTVGSRLPGPLVDTEAAPSGKVTHSNVMATFRCCSRAGGHVMQQTAWVELQGVDRGPFVDRVAG